MSSNSKELQRIYSETHLRRHGHTQKFKMQRQEIRRRFNEKFKTDPERIASYRQRRSETAKKNREANKQLVLEKYGRKCAQCGFADERCLQLDHVNGGGRQHRIKRTVDDIYRDALKDNLGKYQLLCANCNWIKRL